MSSDCELLDEQVSFLENSFRLFGQQSRTCRIMIREKFL